MAVCDYVISVEEHTDYIIKIIKELVDESKKVKEDVLLEHNYKSILPFYVTFLLIILKLKMEKVGLLVAKVMKFISKVQMVVVLLKLNIQLCLKKFRLTKFVE